MNYKATILCAAGAAMLLAGCGEQKTTEVKRDFPINVATTVCNGDELRTETYENGDVKYFLNGKPVTKDQVPAKLLTPFGAGGDEAESSGNSSGFASESLF